MAGGTRYATGMIVKEEGTQIIANPQALDFVGDTVTVTEDPTGTAKITVATAGSPFLMSCYATALGKSTYYVSPTYSAAATSTEANTRFYFPTGGWTVLGLTVTCRSGAPQQAIAIGTVRKNASNTSMTATATSANDLTPAYATDVTNTFTAEGGDYLTVLINTSTSTATSGIQVMVTLMIRKDS